MTKYKREKLKIRHRIRTSYENKRRTSAWKERKKYNNNKWKDKILQQKKPFVDIVAPKKFSFIDNTNEMLAFFSRARKELKNGSNVNFNINNIEELTSDGIAILVAAINDPHFYYKSVCRWNAPLSPKLREMFEESWFYRHVNSRHSKDSSEHDFIHRHQHDWSKRVDWPRARLATLKWTKHTFDSEEPCDFLYNIITECMWNTNNHANLGKWEKCSWWLLDHPEEDSKITSYTFLDLWVGIFDSIAVSNYKKFLQLISNTLLVEPLLSWDIWSRVEKNRGMRWRWIPLMSKYAKIDTLKRFYIVSNDMKIDLRTGDAEKLKFNFKWTLLYWEIQPPLTN